MNIRLKLKHLVIALILGVVAWKAIPVIDYFTGKTIDWKQEAPLRDGRMLIVERRSKLSPSNPFDLSSRMEIEQTLTFKHPDTDEKIKWTIPDGLHPVMIDFDRGIPYFLLETAMSSDFSKWGCPNPPWLAYRYQNGKWNHIAFEEAPSTLILLNLITDSKNAKTGPGVLPHKSYVSAVVVEQFWGRILARRSSAKEVPDGDEARRFSREKINPAVFSARCDWIVLTALGREDELDEESRKQLHEARSRKVSPAAEQGYRYRLENLKQELKERLQ